MGKAKAVSSEPDTAGASQGRCVLVDIKAGRGQRAACGGPWLPSAGTGRLDLANLKQGIPGNWLGKRVWPSPFGPRLETRTNIREAAITDEVPALGADCYRHYCLPSWTVPGDGELTSCKPVAQQAGFLQAAGQSSPSSQGWPSSGYCLTDVVQIALLLPSLRDT